MGFIWYFLVSILEDFFVMLIEMLLDEKAELNDVKFLCPPNSILVPYCVMLQLCTES